MVMRNGIRGWDMDGWMGGVWSGLWSGVCMYVWLFVLVAVGAVSSEFFFSYPLAISAIAYLPTYLPT